MLQIILGILIIVACSLILWGLSRLLNTDVGTILLGLIATAGVVVFVLGLSWFIGIITCAFFPNLVPFCSAG